MNRVICTLLLVLLTSPFVSAQLDTVWTVTIGGTSADGARSICPTTDGGFMVAGYTTSYGEGSADIYLAKLDANGHMTNSYTYGGELRDYANRIRRTSDGGYIIVGYSSSFGAGGKDIYLLKIDAAGVLEWQRTFGTLLEEVGQDVIQTSDGGYMISGYAQSEENGEHDTYIIKVDASGNEVWNNMYDDLGSTWGDAIFQNGNGYVFGGTKTSSGGTQNRDCFLTWIDATGELTDMAVYGSNANLNHDWCHSIIRTNDNGFLLIGHASRHTTEIYDFNVIKVENDGSFRWQQLLGVSPFYDFGRDAVQTADGGYLLCGVNKSTTSGNNVHLIKIDSTGSELWQQSIDWPGSDWADDICEISTGYVIAGQTNSHGNGSFDMLVIKLSNLEPNFTADPSSGHAPLDVNFSDQSLGNVVSWQWDFNNDGVIDSDEPSPSWQYTEPGLFTIKLIVSDGSYTKEIIYDDFISVFDGQSALEFDGDVSYVSGPAAESMNLIGPLTIEAWIYPYGWGENYSMGMGSIMDKDNIEISLYKQGAFNDHSLLCYFKTSGVANLFAYTPENSIVLDEWQHIALTYDGVDQLHVYINGIDQNLAYTSEISGPIQDNLDIDLIVGNSTDGSHTFDGIIDELRIWNTVRSQHLINVCMNNYISGNSDNLILYWRMDEGSYEFVWDASYYLNSGMIYDAAWVFGRELGPTGIIDNDRELPKSVNLSYAYPNPFNSSTIISYQLDSPGRVKLEIFDILGRKVDKLIEAEMPSGEHKIAWHADGIPSGVYFYKLSTEQDTQIKKMMLLK